jgi:hypothetical protein
VESFMTVGIVNYTGFGIVRVCVCVRARSYRGLRVYYFMYVVFKPKYFSAPTSSPPLVCLLTLQGGDTCY